MRRKVKKTLAFLMALTLMVSLMGKDQLFVAAESTQAVETESFVETTAPAESMEQENESEITLAAEEQALEEENLSSADADNTDSNRQDVTDEQTNSESESTEHAASEVSTKENASATDESAKTETTETAMEENSSEEGSSEVESPEAEESSTETEEESVTEETEETITEETTEGTETITEDETETEEESYKGSEDDPWVAKADMQKSDADITVKAYAAKGVLPEDAVLYARELEKTEEEYKEAENLLGKSDEKEMLALDIGFTIIKDGDEVEVEPDGEVRIEMDLSKVVPADVEEASLEINHITEDENGEKRAVTVADHGDGTNGTVAVVNTDEEDTRDVKAEFVTDGFSTFTITWNKGNWWSEKSVTVKYVDENGEELDGFSQTDISDLETGSEITLRNYAAGLSEYTYQGARIGSVSGTPLTQLKVTQDYYDVALQYRNGEDSWNRLESGSTILLVYKQTAASVEPVRPTVEMSHEKYVEAREDGTYDLTLTIAGAVGSQQNKQKLDVIFVLDRSGSMSNRMGSQTRREVAGNAINEMVDSLSSNENIDTRYALVTFSGSKNTNPNTENSASIDVEWTNSGDEVKRNSKPNSSGGTNYQAGIIEAKDLLNSRREGALTAVIFISDGNPGYYYGTDRNGNLSKLGSNLRGSGNGYNDKAMEAAQKELTTLKSDFFYTIGVGNSSEFDRLKNLIADENGTYYSGGISDNYSGTDEDSLKRAFDSIKASITTVLCSNVTVTDRLSDNVSVVKTESGVSETLKITVKDKEGNAVASGNGSAVLDGITIRASYDETEKKIIMDFPDEYELKEGYTYFVTAHIEPTEAAYEAYRGNGNTYPDTGEGGTGTTSAGLPGMFSNQNNGAAVTYTYNDREQTAYYPMPVVQLHPATLTIEKTITGLDVSSDEYRRLCSALKFNVSYNGNEEQIALSNFEYDEENEKFVFTKSGISPGTTYNISEDQNSIIVDGYDCMQTSGNGGKPIVYNGSFAKDGAVKASFCNTYTLSNRMLMVKKIVAGNMGDTEKEFDFTLSVKDKKNESYTKDISYVKYEEGKAQNGVTGTLQIQNSGYYIFKLKHGQSIELVLPNECTYTVTESNGDYGVVITNNSDDARIDNSNSITKRLEKDITVIFTNTREIVTPPTGIYTNIMPGLYMLLAAFAAALWFFFTRRKKA